MDETADKSTQLNRRLRLTVAGFVALGIGIGHIFNLFWAGFFIGLGVALITAARMLKNQEVKR